MSKKHLANFFDANMDASEKPYEQRLFRGYVSLSLRNEDVSVV